jgi:hypothetical protein
MRKIVEKIDNPKINQVTAEYQAGFDAAVRQLRCGAISVVVPKTGNVDVDSFAAMMSPDRPREEFTLKERTRDINYFSKETTQGIDCKDKTDDSAFVAGDGAAMPQALVATDPHVIELPGFRGRVLIEVLSMGVHDGTYRVPVTVSASICMTTSQAVGRSADTPTAATVFSGFISKDLYRQYLLPVTPA